MRLLVEWVLTSWLLILAVTALRALLGRRTGAGLRYALWAAVLVRLLVPGTLFRVPVPAAVFPETGWAVFETVSGGISAPEGGAAEAVPPSAGSEAETMPDPAPLAWVWAAGTAVFLAVLGASNAVFARRLRRGRVPLEAPECPAPVYLAEGLPSPCLIGVLRPAVYLPPETAADPGALRHVLAHEIVHLRHGDQVWNLLRSLALALHWWDPLVWLACALSRRDCELACDAGALRRLGAGERAAYGRTLLSLAAGTPRPGDLTRWAATMTGGRREVTQRIARIAREPERRRWAEAAALLAVALAAACAFGGAERRVSLPEAELTFALEDSELGDVVRMEGTVGGAPLRRGAFWYPEFREEEKGVLSMVNPGFTDGITGFVEAWWADEAHTAVTLTTRMTAMLSSIAASGWWEFTVDLEDGTVTSMVGYPTHAGFSEEEIRHYPASISGGEAVEAARAAATLLTEAEAYYAEAGPARG